jgi:hypothetical protein
MIPAELRGRKQWVVWKWSWKEHKTDPAKSKWDKPPVDPESGKPLSHTDSSVWMEFAEAVRVFEATPWLDGIGFEVTDDDPLCGVDLDDCIDEHGTIADWAMAIVRRLNSYTERTPSGCGLRIWLKGKLPPGRRRKGKVEFYEAGRYFTVTGWHLPATPATVEDRPAELLELHAEVFPPAQANRRRSTGKRPSPSDEEIIAEIRRTPKGDRLWRGDTGGNGGDDSAADLALCNLLAFYGADSAAIERIFPQSGLYRDKWDRADYRERTISRALDDCTERFDWTRRKGTKASTDASGAGGSGNGRVGPEPSANGDDRPRILVESKNAGDSLGKWVGAALDALEQSNRPPTLFQRAGLLSRLRRADADGPIGIEPLSLDALRGVLDRAAYWAEPRVDKKGGQYRKWGPPRMEIVKDFAALPDWNPEIIPHLEAVAESPRFLPDGRLILEPGYHREARFYYNPPPALHGLTIPLQPSDADVANALSLIFSDLLVDFPFCDQASKANALAALILPFVRRMIDGPTPLHAFEAATEGTGKGKLAKACAYPSTGYELNSSPQKENEAEWRKAITTALMSGRSHIFFDNMYNPLGWDNAPLPIDSASLASALTQPVWTDRILGGNTETAIPIRCVWMASGNNVEWSRELTRRKVPIRLVANVENPSERKPEDFTHYPLEDWMASNRVALLRAGLILCQHWIAEGRPDGKQVMGSYEHYARVMGGILGAAGVAGFLANRGGEKGKNRESIRWPALIAAWHKDYGSLATSTGQLYDLIFGEPTKGGHVGGDPELQIAFADILGDGKELSQKQRLGNALAKQEDRVWGTFRIQRSATLGSGGLVLYRLVDPALEPDAEA